MNRRSVSCPGDIPNFKSPNSGIDLGREARPKATPGTQHIPILDTYILNAIEKGTKQWGSDPAREKSTTPSPITQRMQVGLG